MNSHRKVTVIAGLLLAVFFASSVVSRQEVDRLRGKEATLEDMLYLPSSKTVKRLSLGYSSLLADIYWTRAVQYFGSRHIQNSEHFELLDPLLEITTDLDPHLIVAYETGSILLSQKLPDGAGQPDKAAALVEKGISENPTYWRLYFTLGFIHYIDRHDYKAAQQAFQKGSEVPGALPWMKVMAAKMAEQADDRSTALLLWKTIYDTTTDRDIRAGALKHFISLRADAEIADLEERTKAYQQRFGIYPSTWTDLVLAGFLRGVPQDPNGAAYKLMPEGVIQVADPSLYPYLEHQQKK